MIDYGAHAVLLRRRSRGGGDGSDAAQETDAAKDLTPLIDRLRRVSGVTEVVPAFGEVLVAWAPSSSRTTVLDRLRCTLAGLREANDSGRESIEHLLLVRYDGHDLAAVAETCGLTPAQVVGLHTAPTYTVAAIGFQPGFAYLTGLDPVLQLPRRETPRRRVSPGAVAIAASYSAVYPHASPGGWHLIGRTSEPVFAIGEGGDGGGARFRVGDHVRFISTATP